MRTPLIILALAALSLPVPAGESLVVYSGRSESLVGPLLERFTQTTGIDVRVSYQKTPALATQLLVEGADTPADVFLAQDSGYLTVLADRAMLARLPEELLGQVDRRFSDSLGRWVGTSGRARVLVYNPAKTGTDRLPRTLKELADPRFKGRVGWAPGNASFQAHVSALRHLWGEEATREWLEAINANAPVVYPKNSPQIRAVAFGEIEVGWVNHYYLHKLKNQVGGEAANYSFPVVGDAGNVLMASGVGILETSKQSVSALRLVEYLVSEEAQEYFAQETFEYPTRPGVTTHPDVPPLDALGLAEVDQSYLTDLEPTLAMLRTIGLQ